MAKFDTYQEVTGQIIQAIEEGCPPWLKPWTGGSGGACFPIRSTGETYNGINVLMLWLSADKQAFNSAHWFTYKQAQNLNAQVKKGEKSIRVVYYNSLKGEDDNGEEYAIPYLKTYRVFNSDQIEGLPEEFYIQPDPIRDLGTQADSKLEQVFHDMGINIKISDEPRAYYSPSTDSVHVPFIETFTSAHGYYTTLAHELIHATGAKHRLKRDFSSKKPEYAFEELIAEIGACMLCAKIGLKPDFEQSGAYVENWLKCLQEDKKAIFTAASQAQKAADYLLNGILAQKEDKAA